MENIFSQAINATRNRKIRQVGTLYSSMVIALLLSIGVTVVNTRFLGPHEYGDLKFLQNVFAFIVSLLTFGIFVTGSRLLAQEKNQNIKHQLIGNLLILAVVISIILISLLFIFSFFEEDLFNNKLGRVIRIFSPLLFVYPFQLCLENIFQGDNRIYELSIFRLGPSGFYLLIVIPFNYFTPLSLTSALTIQLGMSTLIIIIMVVWLKPKIVNVKKYSFLILKENRAYGFYVYIGIIANVATAHLAGLSIGYFIDNTNVGFFSLALATTTPLTMIASSIGTTLYKDFANQRSIPKKATKATITFSICSLLFFILIIKKMILILYSVEYVAVVPLTYIMAGGTIFRGLGDYFNRFLGAHGRGKEIRNGAFANGISNILGYVFLVYAFGVKGAALTKVISDLIYWYMMYYYYKKFEKTLSLIPIINEK